MKYVLMTTAMGSGVVSVVCALIWAASKLHETVIFALVGLMIFLTASFLVGQLIQLAIMKEDE